MSAFYAKCPECGYVWSVFDLPAPIEEAARRMMAAFCPVCGNDSPTTAPAAEIPHAQQENEMSDKAADAQVTTRIVDKTLADNAEHCVAGPFILHKADPARPRRQHETFARAHREAERLARSNPGSEFIVSAEIARVASEPRE